MPNGLGVCSRNGAGEAGGTQPAGTRGAAPYSGDPLFGVIRGFVMVGRLGRVGRPLAAGLDLGFGRPAVRLRLALTVLPGSIAL